MPEIPPKSLSKTTRRLVQLFLPAYLLFLAPLTLFQRSLIYHPGRCERLLASNANISPRIVAFDVTVRADDGLELHGWLTLTGASPGSDLVDVKQILATGRSVVLYFPGNAGNRAVRAGQFEMMGTFNAHMLLVDYRGYADNSGKPSEVNFARDARSAWNHLTRELGVPPHHIVIYGESLGGGVATRLASDLCREGIEPGGLILQSTFSSLVAVAQAHFSFVPVSLLLVDRYPSDRLIKLVTCPILQIHGQQDSIVPFEIGQRLFEAAPASSSRGIAKRQIVMPNTDHNDVYSWNLNHDKLIDVLKKFLEEVERQPEPDVKRGTEKARPDSQPAVDASLLSNIDWTIVGSILLAALAVFLWWIAREKPKS